jgi:hypothetical protein
MWHKRTMRSRASRPKRPRDPNLLARSVMEDLIGETMEGKPLPEDKRNPAAVATRVAGSFHPCNFRSRRLKNTSDELRLQDERLRQVMVDACRQFGLVVAGYSGRDSSVMDTLHEEVLKQSAAFPAGLFWLHRGEDMPLPRIQELLARANERGVEAALVRVENFNEIMRDLVRLKTDINTHVLDSFAVERKRWTAAPRPAGNRGWPVVRLNALPVTQTPSVCRRVVCSIGGYADLRTAVESAKVDVLVARTNAGVLGFGTDGDIRSTFDGYGITEFDLHTIEIRRLRYESGEPPSRCRAICAPVGRSPLRNSPLMYSLVSARKVRIGRVEDWRGAPKVQPILLLPVSSGSASLTEP